MKILASDYDGTLRTEELVAEKDIEAIARFRKAGNLFGIVTGRSMESLQKEIERNGFTYDFIITNNGGVIYDGDGNLLECMFMEYNHALDIISYIKTLDCVSYVINDGYHRYKFSVDKNQIDHKYGNMPDASDAEETILDRGKIAQMVVSLNDTILAEEIAHYINANFKGYATAFINVNCVDIVPHGVSKAEGLYYIEDHFGLDHDAIYAIGDSFNDLPMLEEFHGSTLSHARSVIKEQIGVVYDSVADCINEIMKEM